MKSHRFPIYARIVLAAVATGVMTACVPVRDHAGVPRHHSSSVVYLDYWYYPEIDSYYDPRSRIYIYLERGHWVHARALPSHVHSHLGRHVIVRSRHERPYEDHRRHREQYAPKHYAPGRSGNTGPGRRNNDVRIGAPRQSAPGRDQDNRGRKAEVRERKTRDHKRSSRPIPAQDRAPDVRGARRSKNARAGDASPDRPRTSAGGAPPRQGTGGKQETGKDQPRSRSRGTDDHRGNDRYSRKGDRRSRNGRRGPGFDDQGFRSRSR